MNNRLCLALLFAVRRYGRKGALSALVLVALLFAGCASSVKPVTDNPTPTPTPIHSPTPTPTPVPSPTPTPTPAPAALAITFTSNRALDGTDSTTTNQPSNIWGVSSDGTGLTPLTNLSDSAFFADSQDAVYSPDGTKIAFSSARAFDGSNNHDVNQVANIWVMNTDGTNAKALTHLTAAKADCVRPVWSPDGTKIAYTSTRALDGTDDTNPIGSFIRVSNVWVINADGTNDIPLTEDSSIVGGGTTSSGDPVWSSDGAKMIFFSARATDGSKLPNPNSIPNIWMINSADGSGRLPLTFYTASGIVPTAYAWFPNSSKIVFSINAALLGDAFGIPNIWVLDTNVLPFSSTHLTDFTTTASFFPSISPDGTKIAFVSTRALDGTDTANTNNTTNIWVMNADGSSPAHLTSLTAMGPGAVTGSGRPNQIAFPWLKDGSKIAFPSARALDGSDTVNTNFVVNIWVMNSDGSAQHPVTKVTATGTDSSEPAWHP
jgi:Tol biopolymer transport system component